MDILLENAIKYAPEDSDISVKLNKNRKYATLKVSNKANVKKGDLSKVFDRFYRLDESRNSAIKGYGIGLSMAQLIAEKHKETIQAYAPEDGIFKIEVRFTLVDAIMYKNRIILKLDKIEKFIGDIDEHKGGKLCLMYFLIF